MLMAWMEYSEIYPVLFFSFLSLLVLLSTYKKASLLSTRFDPCAS